MRRCSNRRGQIWVETVIYTLIGLAVIGLVLAGALPKINEKKDTVTIERSIEALGNIDNKIYDSLIASGSKRVVNLDIKSGSLIIDAKTETISWVLDSSFEYSEVGKSVSFGKMTVTTMKKGDYEVTLELKYDDFNLKYKGEDIEGRLNVAPVPYLLSIENVGKDTNGRIVIDLYEA